MLHRTLGCYVHDAYDASVCSSIQVRARPDLTEALTPLLGPRIHFREPRLHRAEARNATAARR